MTKKGLAFFFLSLFAMVSAVEDRGSCYGVGSGAIAGIIFADVAVTVLIVTTTYWYASKRRQKKENADEVYMNVRANCKT
ncbi:hematopoietic cell signal transducer [Pseudorasbora parva]|uniref:hematopoietic cell signal transducer n=1 Tax=Pseudorasbora parva TaxID=51549 RepID=UPI00351E9798